VVYLSLALLLRLFLRIFVSFRIINFVIVILHCSQITKIYGIVIISLDNYGVKVI